MSEEINTPWGKIVPEVNLFPLYYLIFIYGFVYILPFGKDFIDLDQDARLFVSDIAKICGGGGGGRDNFAQAGGKDGSALNQALIIAEKKIMDVIDF